MTHCTYGEQCNLKRVYVYQCDKETIPYIDIIKISKEDGIISSIITTTGSYCAYPDSLMIGFAQKFFLTNNVVSADQIIDSYSTVKKNEIYANFQLPSDTFDGSYLSTLSGGIKISSSFDGIIKGYGHHTVKLLFVFLVLLFLALMYIYSHFADRIDTIQQLLSGRLEAMSFSEAVSERNYQMDLLRHYWYNPILGMGAGSGEAGARAAGLPGVTDCSYIALLFDVGIIGGFLFLAIMLKSIFRGLHFLKYYLVELGIMFFVLVAMIGSNTIHMGFMFVLPFWYAVGRIWNKDYLKYAIKNKIYV